MAACEAACGVCACARETAMRVESRITRTNIDLRIRAKPSWPMIVTGHATKVGRNMIRDEPDEASASTSADTVLPHWLAALETRHLANLRVSEVTRALRALSSAYVERRHRS